MHMVLGYDKGCDNRFAKAYGNTRTLLNVLGSRGHVSFSSLTPAAVVKNDALQL